MQSPDLTIGLIGGGNMSVAIVRGLLKAGHPATRIRIGEPDIGRQAALRALHPALQVGPDNRAVAADADALLLAVKPQVMPAVAIEAAGSLGGSVQVVLSVAAGITLQSLTTWFGAEAPLARAMPNQPALIGAGISGLVAAPGLGKGGRRLAQYVLESVGQVAWLDDETLLDAVTAVSGSGPAYFYLLMELLECEGERLGLPPALAASLVRATALGAARSVVEAGRPPAELRASVTSPGGTTAAALAVFDEAGLGDIVRKALLAARERSAELGRDAR